MNAFIVSNIYTFYYVYIILVFTLDTPQHAARFTLRAVPLAVYGVGTCVAGCPNPNHTCFFSNLEYVMNAWITRNFNAP